MTRLFSTALAGVGFAVSLSAAQQPEERPPSFRVESTIYTVDAIVTDAKGRQAIGLTRDDFEISVDKRAYPVEHCTYLSLEATDPPKPDHPLLRCWPSDAQRIFVFVISNPVLRVETDRSSRSFIETALRGADVAAQMIGNFLDRQMQPGDVAAVLWVDSETGHASAITDDRNVLRAAVARHRSSPTGDGPRTTVFLTRDMGVNASLLMQQNLRALSAVSQAIDSIKSLPGRKVVVFASRFLLHHSRLREGVTVARRVSEVVEKANENGVVIYSLDLRGLDTSGPDLFEPRDALFHLAHETGGRAIFDENDFRAALAGILEENRGYYLLGFRPGPVDPPPSRIKVKTKRKGLRVQARATALPAASAAGQKSR